MWLDKNIRSGGTEHKVSKRQVQRAFRITVRAVDPQWRCVINASAWSAGDPTWGLSEHQHPAETSQDYTTIYEVMEWLSFAESMELVLSSAWEGVLSKSEKNNWIRKIEKMPILQKTP